jgi:carbon-monoxide dehydrogenase large subunit
VTAQVPTGRLVGARVPRVEDPRFLTGAARYVADLYAPRMLHAAFVRSPIAHGRLHGVDAEAARRLPGVTVLTCADLQALAPLVDPVGVSGLLKTPQPVLAVDRVRFVGEAMAVVLADDRYRAEDAAELVEVELEPLPHVMEIGLGADAPQLFDDVPDNVVYRDRVVIGDVEGAFAGADRVFSASYDMNRYLAAPMETRGCLAAYEQADDRLTFWCSTQMPHILRTTLASALGIAEPRVRTIAPEVGGGFGQKMTVYPEEIVVAFASRATGRPVMWIEDRRENILAATHAKDQRVDIEAAVTADGDLLAIRARFIGDAGAYSFNTASALVEPLLAAPTMPGPYKLPAYEYEVVAGLTNKTPVGPYRGVGWTACQTAREVLFDEVARGLEIDPVEFRLRNMIRSAELPCRSTTGMLYDSGSYVESLERSMEMAGYEDFRARQQALRTEGRYVGIGVSPFVEQTSGGTDAGIQSGMPYPSHDNVSVSLDLSGKVTVAVASASQGQGHATVFAQIAADTLGVPFEDVVVVAGDSATSPFGMGTFASRSAIVSGGATRLAAEDLRERILEIASHLLEASADDLEIENGRIGVRGSPGRTLTLAEIAGDAFFSTAVRVDGGDATLSRTRFYDPPATYTNGCVVAVVEVDAATGAIEIGRLISVEDCGTMLNPTIVDGQVHGALVQGVGGALLEHMVYDESGQPVTTTYLDYLVPLAGDVPDIEVDHIESPSPLTVGGVKGLGESGMIAAPAAVVNAVADALAPFGAAVRRLPLSPEAVLRLLGRVD